MFLREKCSEHFWNVLSQKPKHFAQRKRDQFNSPVLTGPTGAADQQRWTLRPPGHRVIGDVTHCENRFL